MKRSVVLKSNGNFFACFYFCFADMQALSFSCLTLTLFYKLTSSQLDQELIKCTKNLKPSDLQRFSKSDLHSTCHAMQTWNQQVGRLWPAEKSGNKTRTLSI